MLPTYERLRMVNEAIVTLTYRPGGASPDDLAVLYSRKAVLLTRLENEAERN